MTPEQIEQERAAFEAWYCFGNPNDKCFAKNKIGNYSNPCTVIAFNVWLARAQQSAWISVNDRQPETPSQCLVAYKPPFSEQKTIIAFFDKGAFRLGNSCGDNISHAITHWQPLPEPPKAA